MTLQLTITPEASPSPYQAKKGHAPDMVNEEFFGGFADLIDIVNPLQHIPIVSSLYQQLTGDTISTGAKLAGDALFGGALGFVGSIANAIFAQETGGDIASHLLAAVTGKSEETA